MDSPDELQPPPFAANDLGRDLTELVERSRAVLETAVAFASNMETSQGAEPLLEVLREGLVGLAALSEDVRRRQCSDPIERFLSGHRCSGEEIRALRAMGVEAYNAHAVGLCAFTDEELFGLFHCDTETRRYYINPDLGPRDPDRAGLRHGLAPEEIPVCDLRPEQREFFAQHLPDVFARFADEPEPTAGV